MQWRYLFMLFVTFATGVAAEGVVVEVAVVSAPEGGDA